MKRVFPLIFIIFLLFIYGCGKEEIVEETAGKIIAQVINVDIDEEIVTVRLCHDTDNGIVRWVNGSIFGFYDNATRFELKDACLNNNVLIEYYCGNETPMNRTFLCKNGCVDNHCL
tara:strand:- start:1178 stop:1525 length:348 start_codon:yes stop_codon:yes gene_type:complete